ncbi:retrovirus-related pol polyprotein from transposon TNT 1-94, partial [Tanacetum coccineum]
IRYPDWYKGKKAKKSPKIAAHVSYGFEDTIHRETPFDLGAENEIGMGQNGNVDQRLVTAVCSEMMKMFKGKGIAEENNCFVRNYVILLFMQDLTTKEIVAVGKGSRCPYICKPMVDPDGLYKQPALNGAHYFFTIVNDKTRATWTYLIHSKDQIPALLVTFLAYINNHFKAKPKFIRTDNGTEVINRSCTSLFKTKGILHQKSMPYTPQQNEVVERKHMHLLETARSLRVHANLPIKFWGECILAATFLINKMPMKNLQWKSPFEVLFGKPPDYSHLRVIGCLCYAAVTKPHKDKFDNRGLKCILIGYPSNQKGYQLYNLDTKEVFVSSDVVFQESVFPFKEPATDIPLHPTSEFPIFGDSEDIEAPFVSPTPLPQTNPNIKFDHLHAPARKSSRNPTRLARMKDFVTKGTTGSAAFCSRQPQYPLFGKANFAGLPSSHIAFLANVFAHSYKQAMTDK